MCKKLLLLFFFSCFQLGIAQQNEEFLGAKKYFDYQRFMLYKEFKSKLDLEKEIPQKAAIKRDFSEFMVKLDSIQNTAFINTLIKVKIREDLTKMAATALLKLHLPNKENSKLTEYAVYSGGNKKSLKHLAYLFYTEGVLPDRNLMKANVVFVVEKDESINSVQAEGDYFLFNRQAEIAMYLLPQKFSPATINGVAVRSQFLVPLTMKFE